MTGTRLKNLLITNFRSLRGTVAVPLDAPVILLHGTNGMGKTSVLSAIELALTGQIAHLERIDKDYGKHLLNTEANEGSIAIVTSGLDVNDATLKITRQGAKGLGLLDEPHAKFFGERCYLPQSTLGRLLELYQDADATEKTSHLTRFVKDLLGLDQLDALVEGLNPAFHVARIRNLVPEYRRFESLQSGLKQEIETIQGKQRPIREAMAAERGEISGLLGELYEGNNSILALIDQPAALTASIEEDQQESSELLRLTSIRQELQAWIHRWSSLPQDAASEQRQAFEREYADVKAQLDRWTAVDGPRLAAVIESVSYIFPDLPSPVTSNPADVLSFTERRAREEKQRCERALTESSQAAEKIRMLESDLQKARQRIAEIDEELSSLSGEADNLARALAGLVPFVHDENCPVCGRDFKELGEGPLSAHLALSIANLTSQAGRLKAQSKARVDEQTFRPIRA
jgi:DNA repair protein SbcC/Rad50